MTDPKICEGCEYWRRSSGSHMFLCHHYLDTNKRRVIAEDNKCKSFVPGTFGDKPKDTDKPY